MLSKIEILGSSSSGCAYVLYFENGDVYQLDAGVKNPKHDKVKKLFISHTTHTDHDKYLDQFDDKKIKIVLPSENPRTTDNWSSFILPHKVLNNGYIINNDKEKIAYITDCGDWNEVKIKDLSDITTLFVECNWDYFLVKQKIIVPDKYGWMYAFTKKGHMSNLDCLNALAKWKINPNCKIIFVHKSSHHANLETTYKMFDSLPNKKYIAKKGETLYVKSWKAI